MKLNSLYYTDLMVQARDDSFAWHDTKGIKLTEKQRLAYGAGFDAGWRAMISAVRLHEPETEST